MRPIVKITALLACIAFMAACKTMTPILNIYYAPVPVVAATGEQPTESQIRTAIIRAGTRVGWQVQDENDQLVANITVNKSTAVVSIPYSTRFYHIQYRSSTYLREGGAKIDPHYTTWIYNLNRAINTELALAESF